MDIKYSLWNSSCCHLKIISFLDKTYDCKILSKKLGSLSMIPHFSWFSAARFPTSCCHRDIPPFFLDEFPHPIPKISFWHEQGGNIYNVWLYKFQLLLFAICILLHVFHTKLMAIQFHGMIFFWGIIPTPCTLLVLLHFGYTYAKLIIETPSSCFVDIHTSF